MRRTGRRPGAPNTREDILIAARQQFAEAGYRGATIRGIAAAAQVDPALIHHYFGTKRDLFVTVLDFPITPDKILEILGQGGRERVGEQLMRTFLAVWDEPEARDRMRIMLRTAVTDEQAARMLREFIVDAILEPIAHDLGADDTALRATLVASQLFGLALARFVIGIEPLASASHDRLVAAYAPTIDRYLTGNIKAVGN